MSGEVRRQTVVSGGVAWITRVVQAGLSLGAAVVLARLLTPDAFGVFAMVVPIGMVANQLAGQAFQTALLQRQGLTTEETCDLFWFALRMNLVIAVLMAAAGLALAAFFHEPRVTAVAALWAAMTWGLTLTTFQEALLKRALRFPVVLLAQLLGLVVGISCAMVAAWAGLGYWALPIQLLVMEATRAIGVALASRWLPGRRTAAVTGGRELVRAWRALAGYKLATWLGDQPELLAVGRLGGAHVLGLYDTARRWAWYPFEEPYTILTDVAVAGARATGSVVGADRLLGLAITATLTVSLPVIAFVGVAAQEVVLVLLGGQWLEAVPYLRLMSVVAFMGAVIRVSFWIPLARGAPEVLTRWSAFVQAPATLLAVLVGVPWGPMGVATGMAAMSTLLVAPCLVMVLRGGSLSPRVVLGAIWRPAVASLVAAAGVGLWPSGQPGFERLLVVWCVFMVLFAGVWLALPGGFPVARSLIRSVRELLPSPPG